jgi:hypothetical protein
VMVGSEPGLSLVPDRFLAELIDAVVDLDAVGEGGPGAL